MKKIELKKLIKEIILKELIDSKGNIIPSDKKIEPKFYYVAVDETRNWDKKIQKKANGKIYGIYLVDKATIVHAASLQGSYELYPIQNWFENTSYWANDEYEDEITDLERNMDDDVVYVDENTKFPKEKNANIYLSRTTIKDIMTDTDPPDEYNNAVEELIEYYKGNPVW